MYFVPHDQESWVGRERDAAEAFWARGVFVMTPDRFIYDRIRQWESHGKPLPPWRHSFGFVEMGFGGLGEWEPVPSIVHDLRCPYCDTEMANVLHELFQEESGIPLPDRTAVCPNCDQTVRATEARAESAYTFARFFLWVADIGDDWDPSFRGTVESVLGPCTQYEAWGT